VFIFILQVRHMLAGQGEVYLFAFFSTLVWVLWLLKVVLSRRYKPFTEPYRVSTSVVVPVVDEPLDLFRDVLARIAAQRPDEVIVVINGAPNPALERVCEEFAPLVRCELGAGRASALLQQVDEINMGQRERVVELAVRMCGGSVLNHRVGVLGAAFKPHTDDVRDSPALNVAAALHLRGAQVTVYDPEAGDTARATFPTLGYVTSVEEAVEGSDVVLLLTEWDEFLRVEPARLAALTHAPRVIDARGRLDPTRWREAGWQFQGLGRWAA